MGDINENLRHDLKKPEFSEGYSESFLDARIATQIKVLREQNNWTQTELAQRVGTTQTVISRCESVNYSSWNITTLKKFARAFRLRLHVSFETYGSLIHDMERFSRESLQRSPREADPALVEPTPQEITTASPIAELPEQTTMFWFSPASAGGIPATTTFMEFGNQSYSSIRETVLKIWEGILQNPSTFAPPELTTARREIQDGPRIPSLNPPGEVSAQVQNMGLAA